MCLWEGDGWREDESRNYENLFFQIQNRAFGIERSPRKGARRTCKGTATKRATFIVVLYPSIFEPSQAAKLLISAFGIFNVLKENSFFIRIAMHGRMRVQRRNGSGW